MKKRGKRGRVNKPTTKSSPPVGSNLPKPGVVGDTDKTEWKIPCADVVERLCNTVAEHIRFNYMVRERNLEYRRPNRREIEVRCSRCGFTGRPEVIENVLYKFPHPCFNGEWKTFVFFEWWE